MMHLLRPRRTGRPPSAAFVVWCAALTPLTILFLVWFFDSSLPWFSKHSPCRGAIAIVLPIALASWFLLALGVRDWLKARRGPREDETRPPPGA